jgi:hypothetical protein
MRIVRIGIDIERRKEELTFIIDLDEFLPGDARTLYRLTSRDNQ